MLALVRLLHGAARDVSFLSFSSSISWCCGLMIAECKVTIPRPWVTSESPGPRSQARQGKEHREAGLREIAESVPFYQESSILPETPTWQISPYSSLARTGSCYDPEVVRTLGSRIVTSGLVQRYIVPPSEIRVL